MNIVVIGLGSMGKRRIRLIRELDSECKIFGVDFMESRRDEIENRYHLNCYKNIDLIQGHIDCAFVCTSPLSHSSIIKECLKRKWHVFSELNLVSTGYEDNLRLAEENECCLFLSSTFLYREEIKYIRSKIQNKEGWNYIYHVGQYLPDWHPWENYQDYFVGDVRTNGCKEIMAIELPWILKTFGSVESLYVKCNQITDLKIDYPDNYIIQLTHRNKNKGVLVIDVVSPVAVRKFEAYREKEYLSWSGTPDSLMEFKTETNELKAVTLSETAEHIEGYRSFIVENAYKNEIRAFFNNIDHIEIPEYGFKDDLNTISLIENIGGRKWQT